MKVPERKEDPDDIWLVLTQVVPVHNPYSIFYRTPPSVLTCWAKTKEEAVAWGEEYAQWRESSVYANPKEKLVVSYQSVPKVYPIIEDPVEEEEVSNWIVAGGSVIWGVGLTQREAKHDAKKAISAYFGTLEGPEVAEVIVGLRLLPATDTLVFKVDSHGGDGIPWYVGEDGKADYGEKRR